MKARGAFIVLEGPDRCGKSTQCQLLVENLNQNGIPARSIAFPARTTRLGKVINEYLTKNVDLPDAAIHLLFSANRWELEPKIKNDLQNGITLIADRYAFSGVAYSAAKRSVNLNWEWLITPDAGLPKPDSVLYLHLEQSVINERKGFGEERYESAHFQKDVQECFMKLRDSSWKTLDANKGVDEIAEELYEISVDVINKSKTKPVLSLW